MVEITDRESAEAWLATQPHEVQILMASRAALRVLPLVLEDEPDPALILASMRAILTSRAAAVGPARDVKARLESAAYSAARSAPSAAFSAAFSASDSAFSALSATAAARAAALSATAAARSAALSATAAFSAYSADSAAVGEWVRVWPEDEAPAPIPDKHRALVGYLRSSPHWAFWARWFDAVWDGCDLDDALIIAVALIEDEVWQDGVEAVAKAIGKLEQGPLPVRAVFEEDPLRNEEAARLPLEPAKRVLAFTQSYAPALSRRDSEPEFSLPEQGAAAHHLLDEIRQSLTRVVDRVVRPDRPNALREDSLEIEIIRSALELPNSQDWVIALELIDARRSLELNLEDGTYPPDSSTDMLRARLVHHVDELARANDRVAEKVAGYDGLPQPTAPTKETIAELIEATSRFEDNLDPELKEAFIALAETLKAGQEPPKGVLAVLTNWWTTVGMYLDGAKKDEARVSWLVKMILKLWDLWPGGGA